LHHAAAASDLDPQEIHEIITDLEKLPGDPDDRLR
jgi:hypothetical protein